MISVNMPGGVKEKNWLEALLSRRAFLSSLSRSLLYVHVRYQDSTTEFLYYLDVTMSTVVPCGLVLSRCFSNKKWWQPDYLGYCIVYKI